MHILRAYLAPFFFFFFLKGTEGLRVLDTMSNECLAQAFKQTATFDSWLSRKILASLFQLSSAIDVSKKHLERERRQLFYYWQMS